MGAFKTGPGSQPCRFCAGALDTEAYDFGQTPISNRYAGRADTPLTWTGFSLGICRNCGTIQLMDPPPWEMLEPECAWVSYNEPESHLADAASLIKAVMPDVASGKICMLGPYDRLLADALGVAPGDCLTFDAAGYPTAASEGRVSVGGLQHHVTPDRIAAFADAHGPFDLVICRYMVEHAQDPASFLAAVRAIMSNQGVFVLEVPDCTKPLAQCDYSTLWEEHVAYFQPATLATLAPQHGFKRVAQRHYTGDVNDTMLEVWQPHARAAGPVAPPVPPDSSLFRTFCTNFEPIRQQVQAQLAAEEARGGRIAILGAGHLACTFCHLMGIVEKISCVIDDAPDKQGAYLPGLKSPTVGSRALVDDNITMCLVAAPPGAENTIRSKHAHYSECGGEFYSIFPASHTYLLNKNAKT